LIFRRPYFEVIRKIYPFIGILILSTVLIIVFPQIALFLPQTAGI
jgi:TRAP-type C4-dicarboxylate transport system permease large subunit